MVCVLSQSGLHDMPVSLHLPGVWATVFISWTVVSLSHNRNRAYIHTTVYSHRYTLRSFRIAWAGYCLAYSGLYTAPSLSITNRCQSSEGGGGAPILIMGRGGVGCWHDNWVRGMYALYVDKSYTMAWPCFQYINACYFYVCTFFVT